MKNNPAMNDAISAILENIGDNPQAMKALLEALSETGKIAKENANGNNAKESLKHIICLERMTVDGEIVYHPFVMTPPTCENPRMLIVDNAVDAQDVAQTYGMQIQDNVYALPATDQQIERLYALLKQLNTRIVNAIDTAVEAVGSISPNVDKDELAMQYMQQMMANCNNVIGSSLNRASKIIEEDIAVIHPTDDPEDDIDDDGWDEDEEDCACCGDPDCPNNTRNW